MDTDERAEELDSLAAIFPEIIIDSVNQLSATLELAISPAEPFKIKITSETDDSTGNGPQNGAPHETRETATVSNLPALVLKFTLPDGYPNEAPPEVCLATNLDWLPTAKLRSLEQQAGALWEEFGHCQILYSFIDAIQAEAEAGFGFTQADDGCLELPTTLKAQVVAFDAKKKREIFESGSYECGICLDPKPGSSCYRMDGCGHVFCLDCLQDFYNNAITEGDVAVIRCVDPSCGKDGAGRGKSKPLHPRELLAMGIEEEMARRYVVMKRKKQQESDPNTVFCPRSFCGGPARDEKYPPIPENLDGYVDMSIDEEASPEDRADQDTPKIPPNIADRLAVCSRCQYAFCKVCHMTWHGTFVRCQPRKPGELTDEEQASLNYILMNTSPCPTCTAPTSKTHGCNHMTCSVCSTHFCYLCGAWLDGNSPYKHFNKPGTECYQRLWELEEGDNGQAPGDGRGFQGARRAEQMAIEAAREADAAEAAAEAEAAAGNAREQFEMHDYLGDDLARVHLNDPEDDQNEGGYEVHAGPLPEGLRELINITEEVIAAATELRPELAERRAPEDGRLPRGGQWVEALDILRMEAPDTAARMTARMRREIEVIAQRYGVYLEMPEGGFDAQAPRPGGVPFNLQPRRGPRRRR